MTGRLADRVAIVTGAARGIGAVFATAMASEGARVVVADVNDPADTAARIEASGGAALAVTADVTDDDDLRGLVGRTLDAWGRIDILVNNAALFANLRQRPFWDIDEDEWDRVMTVNARGVFQATKAVVPTMRERGYGKIVNVASGVFFRGIPLMLHYVGSKAAVIGMTRSMARELGDDNIAVNAIAPGLTESESVLGDPQYDATRSSLIAGRSFKRAQQPEDLVGALLFLTSPDSDFVTGQTLLVDGGGAFH